MKLTLADGMSLLVSERNNSVTVRNLEIVALNLFIGFQQID
jgi:hypothetical protein